MPEDEKKIREIVTEEEGIDVKTFAEIMEAIPFNEGLRENILDRLNDLE